MNALHSPGQYTTPCTKWFLGENILHTVGENRVEVFFFLQLLILTSKAVEDFLSSGTTGSFVVVAEVLAGTNLKDIQESILALVGNTDKELKVIGRMLGVIENEDFLGLLIEHTASLQNIAAESNGDAVGVALILESFLQANKIDTAAITEAETVDKTIFLNQIFFGICHRYYLSFIYTDFLQGDCIEVCSLP